MIALSFDRFPPANGSAMSYFRLFSNRRGKPKRMGFSKYAAIRAPEAGGIRTFCHLAENTE
jgi:hypothetical protein